MNRHHILPILVLGIAALGGGACSADDSSSSYGVDRSADDAAYDDEAVEEPFDESFEEASEATLAAAASVPPGLAGQAADATAQQNRRTKIITAQVTLFDDDVPKAVEGVLGLVDDVGGTIDARNITTAVNSQKARAYLTVRVPPEDAEPFLESLGSVSDVADISQSEEDVSDQLIDLDVRIENAEASVARVRDMMDKATKIEDLATLEYQLTQRQTALEQMLAQRQNLSNRTAMATIEIQIVEPREIIGTQPTDSSLGGAAKRGWNIFVQSLYVLLLAVVTVAPWLILGSIVFYLIRRWRRRSKQPANHTDDSPQIPQPVEGGHDHTAGSDPMSPPRQR